MKRINAVEKAIDEIIESQDKEIRRKGYLHIYGVARLCALLAEIRGENVELAYICGLLHDSYAYKTLERKEHAHKGAKLSEKILKKTDLFDDDEITLICDAIYCHSDKDVTDSALAEVLKDADVLEHYLYEPFEEVPDKEKDRVIALKEELRMI